VADAAWTHEPARGIRATRPHGRLRSGLFFFPRGGAGGAGHALARALPATGFCNKLTPKNTNAVSPVASTLEMYGSSLNDLPVAVAV
jgi:hypothetical protein